ncbi:hypothetical protein EVAR_46953_1 [Eumeta japonica]|uniref:Helitron helicase-like domain-containing protein n=1 Tax=Eumeta variegata TaxID=151549 RepID=A0A4C1YP09_EUMVA|nr:hypothetical protein EVAR_46953_1 [Eumeta japonica]
MPCLRRRGGNIGQRTRNSQLLQNRWLNRSAEDKENVRNQAAIIRANGSQEQRNERLRANALRQRLARQRVTDTFRTREQQRSQVYRAWTRALFLRLAFEYESDIDYSLHSQTVIGAMNKQCQQLPCTQIQRMRMVAFFNQLGSNHQIGSLMPIPDNDPKFLQIYFMDDDEQQINTRCRYNHNEEMEEREILGILEPFLQNHNHLVQLFNTVSNRLQNDNYTIVIKAGKVPSGQHAGRYNAPTINEVAVVMVGNALERRDMRIQRRDITVHTFEDSHRFYEALQYPLIFGKEKMDII